MQYIYIRWFNRINSCIFVTRLTCTRTFSRKSDHFYTFTEPEVTFLTRFFSVRNGNVFFFLFPAEHRRTKTTFVKAVHVTRGRVTSPRRLLCKVRWNRGGKSAEPWRRPNQNSGSRQSATSGEPGRVAIATAFGIRGLKKERNRLPGNRCSRIKGGPGSTLTTCLQWSHSDSGRDHQSPF